MPLTERQRSTVDEQQESTVGRAVGPNSAVDAIVIDPKRDRREREAVLLFVMAVRRKRRLGVDETGVGQPIEAAVYRRTRHPTAVDEVVGRQRPVVERTQDLTGIRVAEQIQQVAYIGVDWWRRSRAVG